MKKYKYVLLPLVLLAFIVLSTGCTKEKKEEKGKTATITSSSLSYFKLNLNVPLNDEGEAKYEFTSNKPTGFTRSGTVYLETDNAIFAFGTSSWVYQTATKYKEKNGTKDPSYADYMEWMKDPDSTIKLSGMETMSINGRDALRYYAREGGSGDYNYYGYNYQVSLEDITPKSRLEMIVYYKDEELPKEAKEFDEETLKIINSLKLEANK